MSKLFIAVVIALTIVPIGLFLAFGKTQEKPATVPEVIEDVSQEARPDDSPQCAVCRQIESSESQAQCLKDFACS